jgi:hypothetical protein
MDEESVSVAISSISAINQGVHKDKGFMVCRKQVGGNE